jgi:hypothetical protein
MKGNSKSPKGVDGGLGDIRGVDGYLVVCMDKVDFREDAAIR